MSSVLFYLSAQPTHIQKQSQVQHLTTTVGGPPCRHFHIGCLQMLLSEQYVQMCNRNVKKKKAKHLQSVNCQMEQNKYPAFRITKIKLSEQQNYSVTTVTCNG